MQKTPIKEILIIVFCLVLGYGISKLVLHFFPGPNTRQINCGLSEISPDFTPEMKQLCRELRLKEKI